MARNSKIEWCDDTWNIITGCTLVDEGCRHCYAAHLITSWPAIGNHPSRKGLARKNAAGESKFTGEVRFNEDWLDQPLRWKKPRKIFVCAHGDLFHETVPDEWIDHVFAVMALAPQHTFQVLTKRPERARAYLNGDGLEMGDASRGANIACIAQDDFHQHLHGSTFFTPIGNEEEPQAVLTTWPLPNICLGTSISDQASADQRIPHLLAAPAAVRFISAEPLLGEVDLKATRYGHMTAISRLDWVIVGGESGPHARPMHPEWARSLRDQCAAAGVPFLFKQWGEWLPLNQTALGADDAYYHPAPEEDPELSSRCKYDSLCIAPDGTSYSTGTAHQYHRIAEGAFAGAGHMQCFKIGKSRAGRLLDGIEHNGFPQIGGAA
ncbi:MAG: hypothetical protein A3D16_12320 [Rhodobacterales bacterium RIFCSPHIGHO2_02_FULL_62_130]|nr:MAG: hypothetical protein A3D16_12320 [Rhodobacterales bacterium RIFCSPHIGHO2_02_FULL_62_130]OHC53918.1 MAG: hypothetical protein A3E48_23340 [Rhodobacterales bacterium RIFCSPHIGHO2_12_FULL_62_75]HCZ00141.1 phage Gp37/Gp68 family protein [Rhodobacter sp.]